MKVIQPGGLLAGAATVIAPFWERCVLIGASAVQIVLADDADDPAPLGVPPITPTQDVDIAIATDAADEIVRLLEEAGLRRSGVTHERAFTWLSDDVKIQLVRPFHPFPRGAARTLPANPTLALLDDDAPRWTSPSSATRQTRACVAPTLPRSSR